MSDLIKERKCEGMVYKIKRGIIDNDQLQRSNNKKVEERYN